MKNKIISGILVLAVCLIGLIGHSWAEPDGAVSMGSASPSSGVYITPGSRARDLSSGAHKVIGIDQSQNTLVSSGDIETSWAISNVAAANTAATVSKAAGAATVRHVATGFTITFASVGAPTPELIVWQIRDGATGAGTVIWSGHMSLPAVAGTCFTINSPGNLLLVGTAATAMTIETTAGGGANDYISVNLNGYDIK